MQHDSATWKVDEQEENRKGPKGFLCCKGERQRQRETGMEGERSLEAQMRFYYVSDPNPSEVTSKEI